MANIVLKLKPDDLENPDLDIRYKLPDLIAKKSGELIRDDGYDYADDSDALLLFLVTEDLAAALPIVMGIIENEVVLENPLGGAVTVATQEADEGYTIVYPPGCEEPLGLRDS